MLLSKMQTAQNKAVIEGDFLSMTNALQSYKVITGDYPSTEQGLKALVNKPKVAPVPRRWTQIMAEEPVDPWNRKYQYKLVNEKVQLWSKGANLKDLKDDIFFPPKKVVEQE